MFVCKVDHNHYDYDNSSKQFEMRETEIRSHNDKNSFICYRRAHEKIIVTKIGISKGELHCCILKFIYLFIYLFFFIINTHFYKKNYIYKSFKLYASFFLIDFFTLVFYF
jgi:hypothetical protein